MRVLDLFAGLGSGTKAFEQRGHTVVTTDIHEPFHCTVTGDILDDDVLDQVLELGPYEFVWSSPPCQSFSMMSVRHHWTTFPHFPKSESGRLGIALVERTLEVIRLTEPDYWVMENPRGLLRKLPVVAGLERRCITMCQYGTPYMKPTDLWGRFPPGLVLKPMCKNGDPCHVRAPRGSTTGSQGTLKSMSHYKKGTPEATAAFRRMPLELSMDFCVATEAALAGKPLQSDRLFELEA